MHKTIVEVTFIDEVEIFRVHELSYFLWHLKIVYSWLTKNFPEIIEIKEFKQSYEMALKIARILKLKGIRVRDLARLFHIDLKEYDLFIYNIRKDSPLTIWFMGITTILIICFIISGGEIEMSVVPPRIKIKMSSLGEGIKRLKEALKWK